MQKIISLFKRDYEGTRQIYDEIVPGAEWVQAGEGRATRKWDGTCCMVRSGILFKRYDAKNGKQTPPDFEPAQEAADPVTGHWPGWVPVRADNPADKYHMAAISDHQENTADSLHDGTYELVGPNVQGNPDNWDRYYLIAHGGDTLDGVPVTFDALKAWLAAHPIEGVVWHHSDGRMVKIKRKDFGLPWPVAR